MEKLCIFTYDIKNAKDEDLGKIIKILFKLKATKIQDCVYVFKDNRNAKELIKLFEKICKKETDRIFIAKSSDWSSLNPLIDLKNF